uniref:peptidylprolyl isomerase n=1 Tax=Candidatus Kentrum sp. TUN TaxID=2126343 RepID=A0A450ZGA8_9GAMM|nr:MAG: FKBP-type peptidyl-prolyl cis-trans isomerase SlyD [Candidatus Kentron sp. TUN]VFK52791.1 MAG: FKBP-type peptidyl-prolyl cis-trans isomerase SlyD [Candidatus Kentron sp. TUN]VFK57862.1 MAG: FKBP-type peptidyl-prolyl cis-trans isomerase SlyD [Candidatus Kentron sp. TUN]
MRDQVVEPNKVVYLTYEIKDSEDNILERADIPVGYVHGGHNSLFAKIEHTLDGHKVGETVHVTLNPEEGFGEYDPALTFTDDIKNVPPEFRQIGAEAVFENDQGEQVIMVVTRIQDGKLTLDGNHPFAGKTVIFRVTISSIRDAEGAEIENSIPGDYMDRLH